MKLLDPQTTKTEKDKSEEKRIERVRKLNAEESTLTRKVNALRTDAEAEEKRLDNLVQDKRNKAAAEIAELDVKVEARRQELSELLKPIDAQRKSAEDRLEAASTKEADLVRREDELAEREQVLSERIETVKDREDEITEKNRALHARESNLAGAEERHKESETALAAKWASYHEAVADLNHRTRLVTKSEREISAQKAANDAIRESNAKESARLYEERRAIHDSYIALDQAKRHLGVE